MGFTTEAQRPQRTAGTTQPFSVSLCAPEPLWWLFMIEDE